MTFAQQFSRCCGMNVRNKHIAFDALFAIYHNALYATIFGGNKARNFSVAAHFSAKFLYLFSQLFYELHSSAAQSVGALYERTINLGKCVEWQFLGIQLHLKRRARNYIAQQRIANRLI